jgi:hypothetical protein
MEDLRFTTSTARRRPWKGQAYRPKPPLPPKHIWSIRTKLQIEGRVRDLAMFDLAIDSKLRVCDVVAIGSRMPLPAATPRIAQPSGKRKPEGPLDSN